ncbi:MAG: hypothetical protein IPF93_16800 [Saprospiraceae bacterium]|nr:hypothetical protein [Saprospiraceae bacterium]
MIFRRWPGGYLGPITRHPEVEYGRPDDRQPVLIHQIMEHGQPLFVKDSN